MRHRIPRRSAINEEEAAMASLDVLSMIFGSIVDHRGVRAKATRSSVRSTMWKRRHSSGVTVEATYRVLIAESDGSLLRTLDRSLRDAGYKVVTCTNGWELVYHLAHYLEPEKYEKENFDLIVADAYLPGANGLDVLKGLNRQGFPPTILIVGPGSGYIHAESLRYGAAAVFERPIDVVEILYAIQQILTRGA
jgi:CheY-like chemotaxis protein